MQTVGFGVRVCEFGIDFGFTERLASHLEETNQIVVLVRASGNLNDLDEV